MEELIIELMFVLFNLSYIVCVVNCLRKSSCFKDFIDLEFEFNEECLLENFLCIDVCVGSKWYLVFVIDG